jgi:CheY-like chemotaxis protein
MKKVLILIVDDEEDFLGILGKRLRAGGYSVITATNGTDALALAKSERPDLIILDVLMAGMDGPDINLKLKEDPETRDIPVIFLSGMLPKRGDTEGSRIVADYLWLDKPCDILKLMTAIEELLEEKESLS